MMTFLPRDILLYAGLAALLIAGWSCAAPRMIAPSAEAPSGPAPVPPADAYVYALIGHACAERNDAACAHDAFKAALRYDPDSAYLNLQLCRLLVVQGDLQNAAASCRQALALAPGAVPERVQCRIPATGSPGLLLQFLWP